MTDEPILRVQVEASNLEDLRAFLDEIEPDLGCRPVARRAAERFVIDVLVPETQLQAARDSRSAGRVSLRTIEDATEVGRERQREVGDGNRFAARGEVPRGLGRKE